MGNRRRAGGWCALSVALLGCGSDTQTAEPATDAGLSSGGARGSLGSGGAVASGGGAGPVGSGGGVTASGGGASGAASAGGGTGTGGTGALDGGSGGAGAGGDPGAGGAASSGGTPGVGGTPGTGGATGSGGAPGSGGTPGTGGAPESGGAPGSGGAGGGSTTSCASPAWQASDFATVLDVGPGQTHATPSDVPWETIGAGTLVRIHARPAPYRDKWVLNVAGTATAPVVVLGVPDASGALPAIRGDGAVTRRSINFWGEERAIIKIGGSNTPNNAGPAYVHVECLDISGARAGNTFTDDGGGAVAYADNAATITIESGDHVTIRNNVLHDSGNGLFAAHESSDVRVIGNFIHDNGNSGSIYEHNSYTESFGILFEANQYGPLCTGCLGNNLKDRSAGTVIRYNWIESGNRQLDLVDSDHAAFYGDPSYRTTFVYGNVLVEPDGAGNSQIVHYGGDSGTTARYRKGTLHFFRNTVVSTRSGNTTLVRLSTDEEVMEARSNVLFATAGGSRLAISDGSGTANLFDNFLPTGWRQSHSALTGTVTATGSVEGASPGFVNLGGQDFHLAAGSVAIGGAGAFPSTDATHPVDRQIQVPRVLEARPDDGDGDIGAFER